MFAHLLVGLHPAHQTASCSLSCLDASKWFQFYLFLLLDCFLVQLACFITAATPFPPAITVLPPKAQVKAGKKSDNFETQHSGFGQMSSLIQCPCYCFAKLKCMSRKQHLYPNPQTSPTHFHPSPKQAFLTPEKVCLLWVSSLSDHISRCQNSPVAISCQMRSLSLHCFFHAFLGGIS